MNDGTTRGRIGIVAARTAGLAAGLLALPVLGGCVKRTLAISSDPPGALVWLNDREIGRTPLEVEFVHYGTYDVRLEREGCEPLVTAGEAVAPWWDTPGPDFVAEVMPGDRSSHVEWHYTLDPADRDEPALRQRAEEFRRRARAVDPAP